MSCRCAIGNKFFHSNFVNQVEVDVEHDGDLRVLAHGYNGFKNFGWSGSRLKTTLRRKLIHQTVRQRIAERHAEFQNIHAHFVEGQTELARGLQIRITRADIDDEGFLALALQPCETVHDAIHVAGLFRCRLQVASLEFRLCGGIRVIRVAQMRANVPKERDMNRRGCNLR